MSGSPSCLVAPLQRQRSCSSTRHTGLTNWTSTQGLSAFLSPLSLLLALSLSSAVLLSLLLSSLLSHHPPHPPPSLSCHLAGHGVVLIRGLFIIVRVLTGLTVCQSLAGYLPPPIVSLLPANITAQHSLTWDGFLLYRLLLPSFM